MERELWKDRSNVDQMEDGFTGRLLNNKIRVLQRRAYGLRDEEYLRVKALTCMLPELYKRHLLPTRSGEEPYKKYISPSD